MPLARGQHTVLVFKHLQFQGDWTRMNLVSCIGYEAHKTGMLIVVVENPPAARSRTGSA